MRSNIPDLPDLSVEFSSKIKRDTTANGQLKPIMNNWITFALITSDYANRKEQPVKT